MRMMERPRHDVMTAGLLLLAACSRGPEPKKPAPQPIVYTEVDPNTAAPLTGKIHFTGKRPARTNIDMDEDPQCAKLHPSPVFDDPVAVGNDGGLGNVFVCSALT